MPCHETDAASRSPAASLSESQVPMSTTSQYLAKAGSILTLAASLAVFAATAPVLADTARPSACTSDVFRLCNNEVPRVDKMISCLKKSRAVLSPSCRASVNGRK